MLAVRGQHHRAHVGSRAPLRAVITGASGKLGAYLVREGIARGHSLRPWAQSWEGDLEGLQVRRLDLREPEEALQEDDPALVLHSAALSDVNECYQNPELAMQVNRDATARIADWCARNGRRMVMVSTDMVFDGEHAPYAEDAPPHPVSVYGKSKAEGEKTVLKHDGLVVARVALLIGPSLTARRSYYDYLLQQLKEGKPLRLFQDEWRAALSIRVAARTLWDLAEHGEAKGVYHLAGERVSRYEMGLLAARSLGFPEELIQPGSRREFTGPEPRQKDLTLSCERLKALFPDWSPGDLGYEMAMLARIAG